MKFIVKYTNGKTQRFNGNSIDNVYQQVLKSHKPETVKSIESTTSGEYRDFEFENYQRRKEPRFAQKDFDILSSLHLF